MRRGERREEREGQPCVSDTGCGTRDGDEASDTRGMRATGLERKEEKRSAEREDQERRNDEKSKTDGGDARNGKEERRD